MVDKIIFYLLKKVPSFNIKAPMTTSAKRKRKEKKEKKSSIKIDPHEVVSKRKAAANVATDDFPGKWDIQRCHTRGLLYCHFPVLLICIQYEFPLGIWHVQTMSKYKHIPIRCKS